MTAQRELNEIIEGTLEELFRYRLEKPLSGPIQRYLEVLIAYLSGDFPKLEKEVSTISGEIPRETGAMDDVSSQCILHLSGLRLEIRKRSVSDKHMTALAALSEASVLWRGEIAFVQAMAHEVMGRDVDARDQYQVAAKALRETGALRKSVKAILNYLAAESRIAPERKLLADYHHVFKEARKLKEYAVAGQALINISREYQLIGAHLAALKYCNKALALLQKQMSSLSYHLALVHRCHLLFEMGRPEEAKIDYQFAMHSEFAEVKAALKVLDLLRCERKDHSPEWKVDLTATWRERLDSESGHGLKNAPLGQLESAFIEFISQAPREKQDIVVHLYGRRLDYETAENRFKALLGRLRKKRPHLIVFVSGRYAIADEVLLQEKPKKSA